MNKLVHIVTVLLPLLGVACSNDSGAKFGSGGSTSATGGAYTGTSSGGATSAIPYKTDLTIVPVTDAGDVTDAACEPFCNLLDHPYYDPNDPCSKAFNWVTNINVNIVTGSDGDLVKYQGLVYRWIGKDPLTWTQDLCTPPATSSWCGVNWSLTTMTCPIVDITADAGT